MDIRHIPYDVTARRRELVDSIDDWVQKANEFEFHALTHRPDFLANHENLKPLAVGRLHGGTFRLLLLHSLPDAIKANAPTFEDEAEDLLSAGRTALSAASNSNDPTILNRSFSLNLGIVASIFLLAIKVTDPAMRQAAHQLLLSAEGLREGFYDAKGMSDNIANLENLGPALDYRGRFVALEWIAEDARLWGSERQRGRGDADAFMGRVASTSM